MTSAQVVETSVNVTSNSSSQDYIHPDDRNLPTYDFLFFLNRLKELIRRFVPFSFARSCPPLLLTGNQTNSRPVLLTTKWRHSNKSTKKWNVIEVISLRWDILLYCLDEHINKENIQHCSYNLHTVLLFFCFFDSTASVGSEVITRRAGFDHLISNGHEGNNCLTS